MSSSCSFCGSGGFSPVQDGVAVDCGRKSNYTSHTVDGSRLLVVLVQPVRIVNELA
jgi:hypothetical protein